MERMFPFKIRAPVFDNSNAILPLLSTLSTDATAAIFSLSFNEESGKVVTSCRNHARAAAATPATARPTNSPSPRAQSRRRLSCLSTVIWRGNFNEVIARRRTTNRCIAEKCATVFRLWAVSLFSEWGAYDANTIALSLLNGLSRFSSVQFNSFQGLDTMPSSADRG